MKKDNLLKTLEEENTLLAHQIDKADRDEDFELSIKLKKQLYKNKLAMIEEIESQEQINSTINAKTLKKIIDSKPKVPRYETGISALDHHLKGGIEIGTFIQFAGESGAGKTTLVLEILSNISRYSKVLFFNFEMGETRISHRLTRLFYDENQWNNFLINSKARKLHDILKEITNKAQSGIKFFAIDSKMKIEVPEENDTFKAINIISAELAKISQQLEIIVFLINQMNESDIKDSRLAFKGSGDQLYDTDIALFYQLKKEKNVNPQMWKRKLICSKNRQDEVLFAIDLELNEQGKTVASGGQTFYQNINGRYTAKPTETEYKMEATTI